MLMRSVTLSVRTRAWSVGRTSSSPSGADALERRARHQQVPRREAVRIGEVGRRADAEERRQIREAAVGADERRRAGDDRRLQREVLARMHVGRQRLHAAARARTVVTVVIVEPQPGGQRHDRAARAQAPAASGARRRDSRACPESSR